MSLDKDIELLYEVGCLRHLDRMWKQFLGLDVANVAEHTLRCMWTALVIAKREGVLHTIDTEKLLKMVLVHDLSESRSGDAHYLSRQFVDRKEDKALNESLQGTSLAELKVLWEEFEKLETIEAKIARDADLLDVEIEIKELEVKGEKVAQDWLNFRREAAIKLSTQTAKDIWAALQSSNPHDWHLKGSNKFNVAKRDDSVRNA